MAKEQPQQPKHQHTDKCYDTTLYCAKTVHVHTDRACYYQRGDNAGQLKCSQTEHTHDSRACYTTYTKCGY